MSRACSTCGSSDIDFDPSRGDTVCTSCGSVLEESVIVSEVTFQENGAGGSSVVGQFVSNEGNKVGQGLGFRSGFGRESRTVTLENGKRRLQALANQVQLNNHCVESAYMFFKLAVSKRLTKGRRTSHVAAACLYLVCRTEKTPHLLIDFSDVLQVEVMTLGRVFFKLQHELCINLPVIDPCLYIHRFSHQLQFENKEQDVTNTALRLVSRMKRDWIQYGRRPSGLCGAALLVAARLHGFHRTVKEVVKVVRLSDTTIRKRLAEFRKTPSGQLTVDQFNTIDLEEEQDPPSFTIGRQRLKQQQLGEVNGIYKPALAKELESLRREIDVMLNRNKSKPLNSKKVNTKNKPDGENEDFMESSCLNDNLNIETSDGTECSNGSALEVSVENNEKDVSGGLCEDSFVAKECGCGINETEVKENDGKSDEEVINESSSEKVSEADNEESTDKTINHDDGGKNSEEPGQEKPKDMFDNLDDLDDEELDGFILTAPEVEVKTKVWMEENKDYLEKLKEKELEREAKEKEEGELNKKKRRKPYKKRPKEQVNSVGEAVEKMLIEKRISHKINYDVLRNLNKDNELEKPSKSVKPKSGNSKPASSLLQAVQPSIPVRYKGRKRDKNVLPRLPTKRVKFSESANEPEATDNDASSFQSASHANNSIPEGSVVVESGPVDYDEHDQEYINMDDEDEEDVHLSAAQLMGQEFGQGDTEEYGDFDGY